MKKLYHILPLLFMSTIITFQSTAQTGEEDPYLWLEEIEGEKQLDWVREQNAVSIEVLEAQPGYTSLKDRYIEAFNDKDRIAFPSLVGDYVYNLWQDENNERGLWRRMLKADYLAHKESWETVLDLDQLSEQEGRKWVFAGASWLGPENKKCLIYLSDGGTDENIIREFNAETLEFVKEGFSFESSKGGVTWIDENKVLVTRNFGDGTLTTSGYPRQAKILERGQSIDQAELLYEIPADDTGLFGGSFLSEGKRYVYLNRAITIWDSEIYYLSNGLLEKVVYPKDAQIQSFHKGELILSLQSDWYVNNKVYDQGTLVSFGLLDNLEGEFEVRTIYKPDDKSSYVSASSSKDFILINTMEDVQNKIWKYNFENGKWTGEALDTPGFGSMYLIDSYSESNDYFFLYSNFITPRTLYYGNAEDFEPLKKIKDFFNAEGLVIHQYFATSRDGTQVPYFIVHQKELVMNGKNPTLISAYGGFGVSQQPNYSYTMGIGWLEKGGVYVLANIRGGGEYGPTWHHAGRLDKKQNSYNDVYAITEDIIDKGISSPEHIGAFGWSNGGLMAGVLFTQRPDLFNAVVIGAPLLDMKRYSKLLAGASWVGEYGDPDNPEDWAYIREYSPYHNLKENLLYPEVYFVTSTKDDRVHPGHARKMAARMKEMGHPYLYYETIEGGHGAASTNEQEAVMWTGIYTYLSMKLKSAEEAKIKG